MNDTAQILPPYTGDDARCVKCGNGALTGDGIGTGFGCVPDPERARRNGLLQIIPLSDDDEPPAAKLPSFMQGYPVGQEFLARQCGRCGFVWLEACLDDPNLAFGAGR